MNLMYEQSFADPMIAQEDLPFRVSVAIKGLRDDCVNTQSPGLLMSAKVSLATGARWSEAENLQGHHLSKYRITKTKNKKKRTV